MANIISSKRNGLSPSVNDWTSYLQIFTRLFFFFNCCRPFTKLAPLGTNLVCLQLAEVNHVVEQTVKVAHGDSKGWSWQHIHAGMALQTLYRRYLEVTHRWNITSQKIRFYMPGSRINVCGHQEPLGFGAGTFVAGRWFLHRDLWDGSIIVLSEIRIGHKGTIVFVKASFPSTFALLHLINKAASSSLMIRPAISAAAAAFPFQPDLLFSIYF